MPWYCVRTKTNKERNVAHALGRQGFIPYLPMAKDEGADGIEPLFPRYVFANFDPTGGGDFHAMTKTPDVSKVIKFNNEYAIIPDAVIDELKSHEGPDGLHAIPGGVFMLGSEVLITSGPAMGYEGVIRQRKPDRLFVWLKDALGKKFQVSVSYDEVEPIR